MLGKNPSIIQRQSSCNQAPFPHKLKVTTQTSRLVEFSPTLFLESLREVQIFSQTGHIERRTVLNRLSDQQLIDVRNTLVDQCIKKWVNNENYLFEATDRTIEERNLNISKIYRWEVVPRIQAYKHNPLSGNSESQNPKQKLYHLSLG